MWATHSHLVSAKPVLCQIKPPFAASDRNPRWATVFEKLDTDGDKMLLQGAEVHKAFSQVLGVTEPYPRRQLNAIYDEIDPGKVGKIDFRGFCKLVKDFDMLVFII